MNKYKEALEQFVFDAFISGDKDRTEQAKTVLIDHGLWAIWCQQPLRIEALIEEKRCSES